jgi:hypothetical protein
MPGSISSFDSFNSKIPFAIVCTTSECRSLIFVKVEQNLSKQSAVGSAFSNSITSSKLFAYQVLTSPTELVRNKLSGKSAISFIIFDRRTGNSFLRKTYDFLSQALRPEINKMKGKLSEREKKTMKNEDDEIPL